MSTGIDAKAAGTSHYEKTYGLGKEKGGVTDILKKVGLAFLFLAIVLFVNSLFSGETSSEESEAAVVTEESVATVTSSCMDRPDVIRAGRTSPAVVKICTGWGVRVLSAEGAFSVTCYPSRERVDYPDGVVDRMCQGRVREIHYKSLVPDTVISIELEWSELK